LGHGTATRPVNGLGFKTEKLSAAKSFTRHNKPSKNAAILRHQKIAFFGKDYYITHKVNSAEGGKKGGET